MRREFGSLQNFFQFIQRIALSLKFISTNLVPTYIYTAWTGLYGSMPSIVYGNVCIIGESILVPREKKKKKEITATFA